MDRRVDLAVALSVVAFGVFVLVVAQSIRPFGPVVDPLGPATFPRILGAAMVLGGGAIALRRLRRWRTLDGSEFVDAEGEPDEPGVPASARRAFLLMAITFVYAISMPTIGFLIGTTVYISIALWIMNVRAIHWVLVVAVCFTVATYALFGQIANVRLPAGPLLELLQALGLER